MTRTARRRWSREFKGEIDGVFVGQTGPVFLHGYDPPVGGKWVDDVIPGKLGAFDRGTGETLWVSPCEVGYGRGFGVGLGTQGDVIVLGPGIQGHRIARMAVASGELLGASEIEPFDIAVVAGDVTVTITPARVTGILTEPMMEVWTYEREGERYHLVARDGERVYVAFTDATHRRQGVFSLDAQSGDGRALLIVPEYPVIHELLAGDSMLVLLTGRPAARRGEQELVLEAFSTRTGEAVRLWKQKLVEDSADDLPDVSVSLDCGKLYVANGALLSVCDALSGRALGEVALPGLDERIAWQVSQGAGVLAEETRASVFEIPA